MPKKKEKKKKKKNSTDRDGNGGGEAVDALALGVDQLSLNQEGGAGEGGNAKAGDVKVEYLTYSKESQMLEVVALIEKDLSEPYSIFTYRYFIHNWPDLCLLVGVSMLWLLHNIITTFPRIHL
jgi:peptide alpha-N-acetyltransferase